MFWIKGQANNEAGHASPIHLIDQVSRSAFDNGFWNASVTSGNDWHCVCHCLQNCNWQTFFVTGLRIHNAMLQKNIGPLHQTQYATVRLFAMKRNFRGKVMLLNVPLVKTAIEANDKSQSPFVNEAF